LSWLKDHLPPCVPHENMDKTRIKTEKVCQWHNTYLNCDTQYNDVCMLCTRCTRFCLQVNYLSKLTNILSPLTSWCPHTAYLPSIYKLW
jgi:hypothetical protein